MTPAEQDQLRAIIYAAPDEAFDRDAPEAREIAERIVALATLGVGVARGVFGARMVVELVNDGPVTIVLE